MRKFFDEIFLDAVEWIVPIGLLLVLFVYLAFGGSAKAFWPDHFGDMRETGISSSGVLPLGVCIKFQNGTYEQICSPADGQLDIKTAAGLTTLRIYTDTSNTFVGIAGPNQGSDINGKQYVEHSPNVWPFAAAAKTAGDFTAAPGLDSKTAIFADANPDTGGHCPGTTQTLTVCQAGAACVTNNLVYNTYCSGGCATKAAAATALAAAVEALAGVGATVGTITGGASNAVGVTADQPKTILVSWSSSDACVTTSNGTDGCIRVGGLYLSWQGAGTTLYLGTACGAAAGSLTIGNFNVTTGNITLSNGTGWISTFATTANGTYGLRVNSVKGANTTTMQNSATVTFSAGGDATKTATGLIPIGAVSAQVTGYVLVTADAGSCTTFSVGNTGAADPDLYAATVPIAANQTFGPTIASYGPTAQPLGVQIGAAGDVVLTSNGGAGACKNLSVRLTANYRIDTPDTGA